VREGQENADDHSFPKILRKPLATYQIEAHLSNRIIFNKRSANPFVGTSFLIATFQYQILLTKAPDKGLAVRCNP
jgi:hypothetical protein